jgi:glycosyltransferase involved in cell wall biosynthesis
MPKITVIIPLYNKENFIKEALESVLCQTFTDFELIIINDCSTDKSLEIVSLFKDERIKIIEHQTNKGLSASRNTGILYASSNYITFLDADDIWHENYLDTINSLIVNYPSADGFATNYYENHYGKLVKPINDTLSFPSNESYILDFFNINFQQVIYLVGSSLCVKKSALENIQLFNEKITFCEDVDFNIRFNLKHKVAFSNLRLCQYRVFSENQIMHATISDKILPDYMYYEKEYLNNTSLKKYLDFERFLICKRLKLESNNKLFKKYYNEIDLNNLNVKQKLILHSPRFILALLIKLKHKLSRIGVQLNSYSSISRID